MLMYSALAFHPLIWRQILISYGGKFKMPLKVRLPSSECVTVYGVKKRDPPKKLHH